MSQNRLGISIISSTIGIIGIQTAVQAAQLTGEFKWQVEPPKTEIFSGSGSFFINKDKKTGEVVFKVAAVPNPNPSNVEEGSKFTFDIITPDITETEDDWKLNSFSFKEAGNKELFASGSLDTMKNDQNDNGEAKEPFKSFFLQEDGEKIPLKITDLKTKHVCSCTPKTDNQGNLPKNLILTALMKPISASASTVLSMFEQPANAQVTTTDVCSPCPLPESTSTLGFLALGTLGAASTLKRKLKSSKSVEKELEKLS